MSVKYLTLIVVKVKVGYCFALCAVQNSCHLSFSWEVFLTDVLCLRCQEYKHQRHGGDSTFLHSSPPVLPSPHLLPSPPRWPSG